MSNDPKLLVFSSVCKRDVDILFGAKVGLGVYPQPFGFRIWGFGRKVCPKPYTLNPK